MRTIGEREPTDLRTQLERYGARERSRTWTQEVEQALSNWAEPKQRRDRPPELVRVRLSEDARREDVREWSESLGR